MRTRVDLFVDFDAKKIGWRKSSLMHKVGDNVLLKEGWFMVYATFDLEADAYEAFANRFKAACDKYRFASFLDKLNKVVEQMILETSDEGVLNYMYEKEQQRKHSEAIAIKVLDALMASL